MWEKEFDINDIQKYNELIVMCNSAEDAEQFMEDLCTTDVCWRAATADRKKIDPSNTRWEEDSFTCYRIQCGMMTRGSKKTYEEDYPYTPKFIYVDTKSSFHDVTIEDVLGMF